MQPLQEMKSLLYDELELIVRTSSALMDKIKPEDLAYRPADNMRTLRELAEHLAAIPDVDLLILQEGTEEQVRALEAEFSKENGMQGLTERMRGGLARLRAYMDGLSDEAFLQRTTRPFYLEQASTQAKWLVEIVTHAQHHRGQLFTYLKIRGYEVSMFDLY